MEFLSSIFDWFSSLGSDIWTFIISIPEYFLEGIAYIGSICFKIWLEGKIWTLELCYSIAHELLTEYGATQIIESAFNQLPNGLRALLFAMGVPEGIRILFDAYATSLVLKIAGW